MIKKEDKQFSTVLTSHPTFYMSNVVYDRDDFINIIVDLIKTNEWHWGLI